MIKTNRRAAAALLYLATDRDKVSNSLLEKRPRLIVGFRCIFPYHQRSEANSTLTPYYFATLNFYKQHAATAIQMYSSNINLSSLPTEKAQFEWMSCVGGEHHNLTVPKPSHRSSGWKLSRYQISAISFNDELSPPHPFAYNSFE